jgi:hypothetical protein
MTADQMQIYIDESGSLVRSSESPCFVLAALVLKEDLPVKRCIRDIRKKKIKKRYRKTSELKFNTSDDNIKRRILECIGRTNNDIGYALLCNSRIQLEVDPGVVYRSTCKQLVYEIIKSYESTEHVEVIMDKSLYGVQRAQFDAYMTDSTGAKVPAIRVSHVDSKTCPYIQAVDFIAGAINRRYRDNDDLYYRKIEHKTAICFSKIGVESDKSEL